MNRFIILHYGEIGLKKANKGYFVEKLRKFLKMKLEKKFKRTFEIRHVLSRLMIKLPEDFKESEYAKILRGVSGVKNFKFAYEGSIEIEELGEEIWGNLPEFLADVKTFRVEAKRSMELPYKSFELERKIGAILLEKGIDLKVQMKNMDFLVDVELFNGQGYFSFKKYRGPGGLSPNSQGKLIALLSAGIDSPVAAYKMMRRGARVIFLHFHSYPYSQKNELKQVEDLAKILSDFQLDSKLYMIKFTDVQKAIATSDDVPANYRVVMYRRLMLRVGEEIARRERAKGLVTGDSFGQVASQTPENMFAIQEAVNLPVYRPLIAEDKEEIVEKSREIGAFEISKLPCSDTCVMFTPKHPVLKAKLPEIIRFEIKLPVREWTRELVENAEVKMI